MRSGCQPSVELGPEIRNANGSMMAPPILNSIVAMARGSLDHDECACTSVNDTNNKEGSPASGWTSTAAIDTTTSTHGGVRRWPETSSGRARNITINEHNI